MLLRIREELKNILSQIIKMIFRYIFNLIPVLNYHFLKTTTF